MGRGVTLPKTTDSSELVGTISVDDSLKRTIALSVYESLNPIYTCIYGSLREKEGVVVVADKPAFRCGITEAQHLITLVSRVLNEQEQVKCNIPTIVELLEFTQTTVKMAIAAEPTLEQMYYDDLDCMTRSYETQYARVLDQLQGLVRKSLIEFTGSLGSIALKDSSRPAVRLQCDLVNTRHLEPILMSQPDTWNNVAKKLNLVS